MVSYVSLLSGYSYSDATFTVCRLDEHWCKLHHLELYSRWCHIPSIRPKISTRMFPLAECYVFIADSGLDLLGMVSQVQLRTWRCSRRRCASDDLYPQLRCIRCKRCGTTFPDMVGQSRRECRSLYGSLILYYVDHYYFPFLFVVLSLGIYIDWLKRHIWHIEQDADTLKEQSTISQLRKTGRQLLHLFPDYQVVGLRRNLLI